MIVFYIILALLLLMLLITVHEFGHYSAGKLLGFKINEFSIGFGKAIYTHINKKTGEKFAIRIVPLGGYCSFDGEDESKNTAGSFNSQKPWKRLIVLFSGAFFNFVFGIIATIVMLMTVGYDVAAISAVTPNTINSNILQAEDAIFKIDGKDVWALNSLSTALSKYQAGDKIVLTVKRGGEMMELEPVEMYQTEKLKAKVDEKGEVVKDAQGNPIMIVDTDKDGNVIMVNVLGISTKAYQHNFVEAVARSFKVCIGIAVQVIMALWGLITGSTPLTDMSGPFGTIGIIASSTKINPAILLIFIPVISINLAIFNWLPLPALDGGRMAFVTLEAIRKKPIKREIEGMIHAIGMFVLFGLVILIDVVKLFI